MTHFSRLYPTPDDQPIHRPGAALSPSERRAILQDRRWFRSNPDRTIYLREPGPGEAAALARAVGMDLPEAIDGYPLRIAVAVIGPGLRERRPLWTTLDTEAPEEVIRAVMALVDVAQAQGFIGVIGKDEIAMALGMDVPVVRH